MKKLLNISVIAALAVLPMAANAARSNTVAVANYAAPTAQEAAASGIATTSYVKGAYKAASDRIDALVTDTAVAARDTTQPGVTNYVAITAGNSVSENLEALDDKVAELESATDTTTGVLTNLTTEAKNNLVAAINEVDSHADTNATAIALLNNSDNTVEGSVKNSIKTQAETADYTTGGVNGSGLEATTIGGAIDEVEGRLDTAESDIDTLEGNTSFTTSEVENHALLTSQTDIAGNVVNIVTAIEGINSNTGTLASGHYIQGETVAADLTALDGQVYTNEGAISTINNKSINVNTTWGNDTVIAQKKISELPAYVPQN